MNKNARVHPLAAAICTLLVLSILPDCGIAQPYRWVDSTEQHTAELLHGRTPLVRYMYAPVDDSSNERRAETYKPYLHVFSPDGSQILTKGPGGLYPHHRGIFFGYNKITYGDDKHCDTWHCLGKAFQQHAKFDAIDADDEGGWFTSVVTWHGEEGEQFATEHRTQDVGLVDGMLQIDFESKLTPADEVDSIQLDGDPQHSGVQFRASQKVPDETSKQTYYVRTDGVGEPGEARNWNHRDAGDPMNVETTNRPWLALSFVLDGERYTVLRLEHPDNPKPAHSSERDYGRFGSFFVTDVTADDPLDVKYRFVVKQGEMSVDECQALYNAYANAS